MDVLWLLKEINRLFNYRNIKYLCKKYYGEKVNFLSLKLYLRVSFWEAPTHADIIEFLNSLLQLKSEVWEQNCKWLFYYFCFERDYDVLKSKIPCCFLNKNININKIETESKMENLAYSFREMNFVL